MAQLSPKDRALLHLYDSRGHMAGDRPYDTLTQAGISSALGVNRTHITRVLRPLINAGMVEVKKGHVTGKERKLTYYILTELGLPKVKAIISKFEDEEVELIEGGQRKKTKVRTLLKERPEIGLLQIADAAGGQLKLRAPQFRLIDSNVKLELKGFLGRENQLRAAREFLDSQANVLAVFANYGYGSSTFMKKVALEMHEGPLFWHDIELDGGAKSAAARLHAFATTLGTDGSMEQLMDREVMLCFDNYHEVSEGMVDLLVELMTDIKGSKAKMAVAMREETPSYNRFFQKADLDRGFVTEVHLQRFDEATARKLMGDDIDDEAFQLIYMLTRGQPLALALTKRGNEERLREIRLSEEVRFLMYLRTKTKTK